MPLTLYFLESFALMSRSEYGSASQGISPKYSVKAPSSRSLEAKTISMPSFSAWALYHSASLGVKPRHGGHQWACVTRGKVRQVAEQRRRSSGRSGAGSAAEQARGKLRRSDEEGACAPRSRCRRGSCRRVRSPC